MATLTTEIFSVHGQETVQEKENASLEKHASIAGTLSIFLAFAELIYSNLWF